MSVNICKYITLLLCVVIEIQCQQIALSTRNDRKEYQFFPLQKDYFEVDVKANNDIHIVLTENFGFVGKYYEIVYGGWDNTRSVIRTDYDENVKTTKIGRIINSLNFEKYWVQIDRKNKTISTGKVPNKDPYMYVVDESMPLISYFGVSTGFGSSGAWHIDTQYIAKKSNEV